MGEKRKKGRQKRPKKVKHERNENFAYVALANLQSEESQEAELERKVQSTMEKSINLIANGKMGLKQELQFAKLVERKALVVT